MNGKLSLTFHFIDNKYSRRMDSLVELKVGKCAKSSGVSQQDHKYQALHLVHLINRCLFYLPSPCAPNKQMNVNNV